MNRQKTLYRQALVAVAGLLCLLLSSLAPAAVKLSLTGIGEPSAHGFGARGLFLGGNFSSSLLNHPYTNWTWSDLDMTIQENGNATISGSMTRDYNSETWGINIQLDDIEFRRPNDSYKSSGNWSGNVNEQSFLNLAEGINPFTNADWSGDTGWGFEWKSLDMTLDKLGNSSSVPETGWEGFAMPDMGHPLVAELHYNGDKGLTFEAWYKNPGTNSWYDVGDTKSIATVKPSSEIPEPLGMALLTLGLLGVGVTRRRGKHG